VSAVEDAIERAENDWYHPMAREDRRVLAEEVKRLRAQVAAVEAAIRQHSWRTRTGQLVLSLAHLRAALSSGGGGVPS